MRTRKYLSAWMRPVFWGLASAALLLTPLAARADPADELETMFAACADESTPGPDCERPIWAHVDITGDDALSRAEISRFARMIAEVMKRRSERQEVPAEEGDPLVIALLVGPFMGEIMMSNFDYDGDGRIQRGELYTDIAEGELRDLVDRLASSGMDAFSDGMEMMMDGPEGSF